jgi:hypothetical protein
VPAQAIKLRKKLPDRLSLNTTMFAYLPTSNEPRAVRRPIAVRRPRAPYRDEDCESYAVPPGAGREGNGRFEQPFVAPDHQCAASSDARGDSVHRLDLQACFLNPDRRKCRCGRAHRRKSMRSWFFLRRPLLTFDYVDLQDCGGERGAACSQKPMLPIVPHFRPDPSPEDIQRVDRLADGLLREYPTLQLERDFRRLVPERIEPGGTLHVDDLTAISFLDAGLDVRFYQERARLRAGDGDLVATAQPVADGYESYCHDYLGLGAVQWLHPAPSHTPGRIAESCWEDPAVRRHLVERMKAGELAYVHPHMGTFGVWEVAALLSDASGVALKVVAPPPGVSTWLNDKVAFAELVSRLFGETFVPRTMSASNFAVLAQHVKDLSAAGSTIGIKLPDSAGGDGTLVLDPAPFVGQPLRSIRETLKGLLPTLRWSGERELLVDVWETEILCSPSAQLWIPPRAEGEPVVEALFSQVCAGRTGVFVGTRPAELPELVTRDILNRCWLIARLCQRLGYIGRCSFDLILIGSSPASSRLEFIECNGRWGGASAPMTLMNRLFGDWAHRPYVSHVCWSSGLDRCTFSDVLALVREDLFDRRTQRGRLILTMPGRLAARSAIDVIALGDSVEASVEVLHECFEVPVRRALVERPVP